MTTATHEPRGTAADVSADETVIPTPRLRVVFMGSADFSIPVFEHLRAGPHHVVAAYTQPPKPVGRGHAVRPVPMHSHADACGVQVFTPRSLRVEAAQAELAALDPDVAVVAAYGLILPQAVLDLPRLGCVNVHASLLPRWRGAAPIHRALLAGDAQTGVTIMQMDAGVDTGPMLLWAATDIRADQRAGDLASVLGEMGGRLIEQALRGLALGRLAATPQPDEGVTYAAKITPDDGRVDWQDAAYIERQGRAFEDWPSLRCRYAGQTLALGAPVRVPQAEGPPGTVLDDQMTVACARNGGVRIGALQRPGRRMLPVDAFLRGCPIPPGTVLEPG